MQIPHVLSTEGDFDHNFAYFSVNSMSKGLMKNHIKIYDFKEFWFDAVEREEIQLCQRGEIYC